MRSNAFWLVPPAPAYDNGTMDALTRLLAERACERLMVDYAWAVDSGRAVLIADLFTDDGVWEGADGGGMRGRETIVAAFTKRQALTRRASRHVITNQAVDVIDENTATGRAYLINYRHDSAEGVAEVPAPAGHPKFVGEYHLQYVNTPDGWRIKTLRFTLAFLRRSSRP